MNTSLQDTSQLLAKLGVTTLNPMQKHAIAAIHEKPEVVLLSPTGTGKTLAFMVPIIEQIKPDLAQIQALILVPSRELAQQIEQVVRALGAGFKANAIYGGRAGYQDKLDLKHPPALLIGTPGRVADHLRRGSFNTDAIQTIVLDEFDKSLEIGFEKDMAEIINALPKVKKRILTSATTKTELPGFLRMKQPLILDYLWQGNKHLRMRSVMATSFDTRETLAKLLVHLGNQPGIIFCNFKESIRDVSETLTRKGIEHGCFSSNMDQTEREKVLVKFRNGTLQLIVASDLAARGLDIPELRFIIHFELPNTETDFTHRNGRTARMNSDGTAYIIIARNQPLREYLPELKEEKLADNKQLQKSKIKTLYIAGGRRDKISKADIAGLFLKQGQLNATELGRIEVKQECAYVAVPASKTGKLVDLLNNSKLKTKRVRISEL